MPLPEDANERRMFDFSAEVFGSPLKAVGATLKIWHSIAPPGGSYKEQLAIMANEIEKATAVNT